MLFIGENGYLSRGYVRRNLVVLHLRHVGVMCLGSTQLFISAFSYEAGQLPARFELAKH